jgi:hypothetical protein
VAGLAGFLEYQVLSVREQELKIQDVEVPDR